MLPEVSRVCLIEDDMVMGGSLVQRLEIEGREVWWSKSGCEAIETVAANPKGIDVIVCDMRLPDLSGEQVFERLIQRPDCPPFLFITAHGEIDQAVRLMRAGAADFMTKPFAMDEFMRRLGAVSRSGRSPDADVEGALGESRGIRSVELLLRRYAENDLPVFITGETGTGKEVAARFLHSVSSRRSEPFMAVNCAAIPADLLESELFGHERGAFTGAHQRHLGYAERAREGILFLDEIGDMPSSLQVKLLRLLENGSFHRLGGEEEIPFRARVVAATHRNLTPGPAQEGFRDDLYFRLAVLPVEIPALRDRPEDVVWLMEHFFDEAVERSGARLRGFGALTIEAALSHGWPGNIRELRNRVERAVAVSNGEWIQPGDLFPDTETAVDVAQGFPSLADVRDAAERRQIGKALEETKGQIGRAAKLLGISRNTLWEKMTRYRLSGR